MTTITTTGHQRPPLIAALAAGAALVVGGAIGFAWEQDNQTPTSTHAPAYTHSYTPYFYRIGPTTSDELSNSISGSPAAGTTADEFSGTTHPYPTPRTTSGSTDRHTTSYECRGCLRSE
jgi:hypothetical protein